MVRQIFQLKVTLQDVVPPVWRQVLIPGGYTLDRVHRVIQLAFGWQDYHLHSFEIDGVQYGQPDPEGDLELRDELDVRLDAVAGKDSRFVYTYDFGDWWEHGVEVEAVSLADPDERYPLCLDGERACPPEDVGGAYGFANLLAALADPAHRDHEAMLDWLGRPYDPAAFDAGRATTLLRRLA
jgi:hypothetical protein